MLSVPKIPYQIHVKNQNHENVLITIGKSPSGSIWTHFIQGKFNHTLDLMNQISFTAPHTCREIIGMIQTLIDKKSNSILMNQLPHPIYRKLTSTE